MKILMMLVGLVPVLALGQVGSPLPSTAFTRDWLRSTNATEGYLKLGLASTNQTTITNWVTLVPDGSSISNANLYGTNVIKPSGAVFWEPGGTNVGTVKLLGPEIHDDYAERIFYMGSSTDMEAASIQVNGPQNARSGDYSGQLGPRITLMFGDYTYGWRFEPTNFTLGDGTSYAMVFFHNNTNSAWFGEAAWTNSVQGKALALQATNHVTVRAEGLKIAPPLSGDTTNPIVIASAANPDANGVYYWQDAVLPAGGSWTNCYVNANSNWFYGLDEGTGYWSLSQTNESSTGISYRETDPMGVLLDSNSSFVNGYVTNSTITALAFGYGQVMNNGTYWLSFPGATNETVTPYPNGSIATLSDGLWVRENGVWVNKRTLNGTNIVSSSIAATALNTTNSPSAGNILKYDGTNMYWAAP